jgi:hypothetical protein
MLVLQQIKRTDNRILNNMAIHYSQPKGFVGRNICYAVLWNDVYFGSIVGGSATLHLPNRNEYFNIDKSKLNNIVNNIFFHIERQNGKYPCRWFSVEVLSSFRERIVKDWELKYEDKVIGFESLVELPRSGDCYKKDDWDLIGQTVGYTCKRIGGEGTDGWSGKRVWDTKNLRPKLVFAKKIKILK